MIYFEQLHFVSVALGMTEKKKKPSPSPSPCAQIRDAYHNCFHRWYSEKYVKGQFDKEGCVSEWQKYKDCLSEHLDDKHLARLLEAESFCVD